MIVRTQMDDDMPPKKYKGVTVVRDARGGIAILQGENWVVLKRRKVLSIVIELELKGDE